MSGGNLTRTKKLVKAGVKRVLQAVRRSTKPAPALPVQPVSLWWGYDRGTPIGRFFIDEFIGRHRGDIRGAVLEIKNRRYTGLFGGGVTRSDVLDIDPDNPEATIITDLAAAVAIPSDSYDCFMLTETLQYIYDLKSAVFHAHRIIRPGGVLLVTVPAISPLDGELAGIEQWRFTVNSCRRLFGDAFGSENVEVEPRGNFRTCLAALSGMAKDELDPEILLEVSDMYAQWICVRARKS